MASRQNAGARNWERVAFRFRSSDELSRAKAAAARAGVSLNDFARDVLVAATAQEPTGAAELVSTQSPHQLPGSQPDEMRDRALARCAAVSTRAERRS